MKDRTRILQDSTKMQVNAYTEANYDAYMHGMANGLILANAIMRNEEPEFLKSFKTKKTMEKQAEAKASRPKEPIPYDH